MVNVRYSGMYYARYRKLVKVDPTIIETVSQCTQWFKRNPNDTRLRNHELHKGFEGKWAFSITDDIRIVYEWTGINTVRFLAIGSHATVYKKSSS